MGGVLGIGDGGTTGSFVDVRVLTVQMKMEPRCGLAIGFYRDGGKIEREREREIYLQRWTGIAVAGSLVDERKLRGREDFVQER